MSRFLISLLGLACIAGCSTDSTAPAPDGGAAGAGGGSGGGATGGSGGGGTAGASSGGAASIGDAAHASPECVTYCTCMAKNCADKVFPGGCLAACSAGTSWDLPCRQNMCKLVPDQPANDHCTHAFGTSECN